MADFERKDSMITRIRSSFSPNDLLDCSRQLSIEKNEFYNENLPMNALTEKFVERVYQQEKQNDLETYLHIKKHKLTTSDKSAQSFGKLLNVILKEFDKSEESIDFEESELFEPIEFEGKMRNKAKLSEDIIAAGIRIKPDIVVLRRKAKALNCNSYDKLIQKLARFYKYDICTEYPITTVSSAIRFNMLYKAIEDIIPDDLYDEIEDIEMNIEGLIYDTISKCLILMSKLEVM